LQEEFLTSCFAVLNIQFIKARMECQESNKISQYANIKMRVWSLAFTRYYLLKLEN